MVKEQIPIIHVYINIFGAFWKKKFFYCVSLTSVENDVNDIFSFAFKPNFLINSIFSFDNCAFAAVPAVDCWITKSIKNEIFWMIFFFLRNI